MHTFAMIMLKRFWTMLFLISAVNEARRTSIKPASLLQSLRGVVEFYKFEACNVSWNQAVITGFKLCSAARDFRGYNADLYVKTDLIRMKAISFKIKRCKDAVSYNTCEHFALWKYDQSPCDLLIRDQVFRHSANSFVYPPISCPYKANVVHKFRNFSYDATAFIAVFGIDAARRQDIYEFEVTDYNEHNKNFGCYLLQFKFIPRVAFSP